VVTRRKRWQDKSIFKLCTWGSLKADTGKPVVLECISDVLPHPDVCVAGHVPPMCADTHKWLR
jgi:hypothetical protein